MKKVKKPDNVVYDVKKDTYDARLKEYGTNVGAPAITIENIGPWKTKGIQSANNKISAEFEELKQKLLALQECYEHNQMVYSAEYRFKPIIGKTYHLYKKYDGNTFLSILGPQECNFDYIASFRLDSEMVWTKI